ncbi:hypothetical protein SAY87_002236 [Trapa incisa]|uniref:Protein SKIP34 n=1 Tax=Trapa incisa TaxID=236973 RepID=A0AAN7JVD6_9MYRT|nr:hypothetical protein SAY87_002236 [Trapa incisa]
MCYGAGRPPTRDQFNAPHRPFPPVDNTVEDLRGRLAETEARLARARAREAELSRRLEEMRRFVSVMEILGTYLKRRFVEERDRVEHLLDFPLRN